MGRAGPRWTAALVALLAIATPVWSGDGRITGTVLDGQTDEPLPGASVVLDEGRMGAVTGRDGRFLLLRVPPGTHTVRVSHVGYAPVQVRDVSVSADLTSALVVRAEPRALRAEEVVVHAERPLVDRSATNAVRILDAEDVDRLPGRGVHRLLAIQPGVVDDEGRLHVRGSRADEIAAYVEGGSVRNVITGATAIPLIDEALTEVQLQAGGFNAEYGGAHAGLVLHRLRTGGARWQVGLRSETDGFAGQGTRRLDTFSYGFGHHVLTVGGPLDAAGRVRAFVATQRRQLRSEPRFWSGFRFDGLTDTGSRGGRVHWLDADGDGTPEPDAVPRLDLTPGHIEHTSQSATDVNATLVFDWMPLRLQLTGLGSRETAELNPAPVRNLLNTARLPEAEQASDMIDVRALYVADASLLLELGLTWYRQEREVQDPVFGDRWWVYNDSVAVARADAGFTPYTQQGIPPSPYDAAGFPFHRPGTPTSYLDGGDRVSYYGREHDRYRGVTGAVTKQAGRHQLKAGFEVQRWTSRRYLIGLGGVRSGLASGFPHLDAVYRRYYDNELTQDAILGELIAAAEAAPAGEGDLDDLKAFLRTTSRADVYGYDEFGRQRDAGGLEAPRRPRLGAVYVQDKAEYDDLIVNAGLRLETFDVDSWRFVDPAAPVRDAGRFTLDTAAMRRTRTFTELSPRLGLAFPVSQRTVFHVQYGRFSQMPEMRSMYAGGARLASELGGQDFINNPTGFDIEPMRTTQYELGFERQFAEVAAFDITGFYRDVKGQIEMARQALGPGAVGAVSYNYLRNGDFATVKGLELVVKLRRTRRLRSELSYTLSDARGTGSTTMSDFSGIENAAGPPTVVSPLDFNQTHRGALVLDYRFGPDDGVLRSTGANLLLRFDSGHNYTLSTGSLGQTGPQDGGILSSTDPRNRQPLEPVNASTTPWTLRADLRLDRTFRLGEARVGVYATVLNLFDRRNVLNVYQRTGNDRDDGFLTDPSLSSEIVAISGGDVYQELYRAINLANRQHYWFNEGGDLYDTPRQMRFGIELEM